MDDDDVNELRNPFPSPPSQYTKYTSHNLRLLALLKERVSSDSDEPVKQQQLLSDQKDVPDWDLTQLEKPRVDWILDEPDAYYEVYGDRWFVKETIPSLAELGGTQLYPADPSVGTYAHPPCGLHDPYRELDRRPALLSVLKSLLVTHSNLISSLLQPPPLDSEVPPEWQRQVEWINVLSQNLMAAANDLRPMQARCNLELMMQRQLDLRKEETRNIHAKCDALEAKLKELRSSSLQSSNEGVTQGSFLDQSQVSIGSTLSNEDVIMWAEQV